MDLVWIFADKHDIMLSSTMNMPRIFSCLLLLLSSLAVANGSAPSTFCRFVPERMDDFAWENDKVAFRAYGPALKDAGEDSGFDCWLKRVDYPIIDKWYAEHAEGKSYHKDHGEGYDPYKVGSSRGCGGLGLWIDGKMVISNVFTKFEVIQSETDESIFELTYEWVVGSDTYTEVKRISIKLGDQLFQSTSIFKKNGEIAANLPIAVGLVRHHKTDAVTMDLNKGWVATWETIDGSGLGTGLVMDPKRIDGFLVENSGQKLSDHALLLTKTDSKGQLEYFAGFGWELAKEITTLQQWSDYLNTFTETH